MNVYDFDNTIYDGESAFDFFKFFLKKDKKLITFMPSIIIAFTKYKFGKLSIEEAMNKYGQKAVDYYLENPQFRGCISEFWDSHIKNIKPFYETVRKDDDLILSCSPEISLKEVCERLNIKSFIGTSIDEEKGKIDRLCLRENKVKAFFEQYPDSQIDDLYTDSFNDKPLMDISKNVYLVKGNKIKKIK
ncbi:MAG: haloacid dehalogenase-like hydrolase [Clostridia bacterium]|nr:haloacid dehalogenase-like hydrolase [Clostridia bacterium]